MYNSQGTDRWLKEWCEQGQKIATHKQDQSEIKFWCDAIWRKDGSVQVNASKLTIKVAYLQQLSERLEGWMECWWDEALRFTHSFLSDLTGFHFITYSFSSVLRSFTGRKLKEIVIKDIFPLLCECTKPNAGGPDHKNGLSMIFVRGLCIAYYVTLCFPFMVYGKMFCFSRLTLENKSRTCWQ